MRLMYELGIVHAVFLCMDSAPCAFFVPVASECRRKSMESILIYVLFAVGIVLIVKARNNSLAIVRTESSHL